MDRITRTAWLSRPLSVTPAARRRISWTTQVAEDEAEPAVPDSSNEQGADPAPTATQTLTPAHEAQLRSMPMGDITQAMARAHLADDAQSSAMVVPVTAGSEPESPRTAPYPSILQTGVTTRVVAPSGLPPARLPDASAIARILHSAAPASDTSTPSEPVSSRAQSPVQSDASPSQQSPEMGHEGTGLVAYSDDDWAGVPDYVPAVELSGSSSSSQMMGMFSEVSPI